jgi:hypothetical protein
MQRKHSTKDYLLLRLPENPCIFAVTRLTDKSEKAPVFAAHTEGSPEVYQGMTYLISPFYNYITGDKTPACNCRYWRVTKKRCIHLKKFFELNPHLDPETNPNAQSLLESSL